MTKILGRHRPSIEPGLASGYRILLNQEAILRGRTRLQDRDPQRTLQTAVLRTLCHELAHVHQYELTGGNDGPVHEWLIEGHASFIAAHVLDRMGLRRFEDMREEASRIFAERVQLGVRLATLAEVSSREQWAKELLGAQTVPSSSIDLTGSVLYLKAMFAVELLVRDDSSRALRSFLARFSTSNSINRDKFFRESFGMTLAELEKKLGPHLLRRGAIKPEQFGDFRIVAGERLGSIRLGMTARDAERMIGKECSRWTGATSPSGKGGTTCTWSWTDQRTYQTADETVPYIVSELEPQSEAIFLLITNIKQFKSRRGNSVGDPAARFEAEFGRPVARGASSDTAYMDFPGLRIVFNKATGIVTLLTVQR